MPEPSYISVTDPPSALRPPPPGFHYDPPSIVESPQAYTRFLFSKINATPNIHRRTLSKPIEYIAQRPITPDIACRESVEKISSNPGEISTIRFADKLQSRLKMPLRKRRSLHSIILPAFLQSPSAPTYPSPPASSSFPKKRPQSASKRPGSSGSSSITPSVLLKSRTIPEDSRSTSPTPFLDEDPFANISGPPAISPGEVAVTPPLPPVGETSTAARSPPVSHPIKSETIPPLRPFSPPVDCPNFARPKSSGNGQVRPAYMKPAFSPRPSLPSLHTLAQMNVVIPKKVSKHVNI